jgi:hypothetical protein
MRIPATKGKQARLLEAIGRLRYALNVPINGFSCDGNRHIREVIDRLAVDHGIRVPTLAYSRNLVPSQNDVEDFLKLIVLSHSNADLCPPSHWHGLWKTLRKESAAD